MFTGNLQSLSRQDAMQQVVNLGAIVHPASVSLQTRWVVLGGMGKKKNGQPFVTSKLQMARALIEEGKDIEIIDEKTFLEMLDS